MIQMCELHIIAQSVAVSRFMFGNKYQRVSATRQDERGGPAIREFKLSTKRKTREVDTLRFGFPCCMSFSVRSFGTKQKELNFNDSFLPADQLEAAPQ